MAAIIQCLWRHSWRQGVAARRQSWRNQCLWRQSMAAWRQRGLLAAKTTLRRAGVRRRRAGPRSITSVGVGYEAVPHGNRTFPDIVDGAGSRMVARGGGIPRQPQGDGAGSSKRTSKARQAIAGILFTGIFNPLHPETETASRHRQR
eukprot:gene15931-biopygen11430